MSSQLRRFAAVQELVSATVDEVLNCDLSRGVALTGGRVGTQVSLALVDALITTRHPQATGGDAVEAPIRLWFSDERFLPSGDPDRNDSAVLAHLARTAGVPSIVAVESALGPDAVASAESAAEDYESRLAACGVPAVAVLSVGPDGHVASLFPGHALLSDHVAGVRVVHDSPKPPPVRVTWTLLLITAVPRVLLLAAGDDKRETVERVIAGDASLPATLLLAAGATMFVA